MIKFKYINFKRVSAILLSGIILVSICGCSGKKDKYIENNNTYSGRMHNSEKIDNVSEIEKEATNIEQYSNVVEKNESSESFKYDSSIDYLMNDSSAESLFDESTIEKYKMKDVIDFLEKIDDTITEKGYQAKDELIKDYGIVHDFVFEDGTIKGYTFDELKDSTKAKVLSLYLKIDEKIEKHFPQYKETIKEKFGKAKDKVKSKLSQYKNDFIEYFKDEIGEEKYNNFIDTKNKYVEGFKEQTKNDFNELKELGGKAKDKVKSWFKKN